MSGPAVLTSASSVTCPESAAAGFASSDRLTVGSAAVLLAPGPADTITISSSCTVADDPNTSTLKCRTVQTLSAGTSSKLTVGGVSVLLGTLAGTTDGTPPPTGRSLLVSAGQDRLHAAAAVA